MTPRQLRRMQKKLADQMERERNGEPIPGEIQARMTKIREDELFQVFVELQGKREPIPVGPKMPEVFCEELLMAINAQIALGKERTWTNPHILACVQKDNQHASYH